MPRPQQRVRSKSLKLDLNTLRRQELVSPGAKRAVIIRGAYTYTGEEIANGVITSNMEGTYEGCCESNSEASINDYSGSKAPLFWRLSVAFRLPSNEPIRIDSMDAPGATRFCSRQAWGRRGAYASQFADPDNRAHRDQAKIGD